MPTYTIIADYQLLDSHQRATKLQNILVTEVTSATDAARVMLDRLEESHGDGVINLVMRVAVNHEGGK